MAKVNGSGADEGAEVADAPLIDLNDADIKKLIARAKKRGYITVDQLNEMLPQDQFTSEQIEDVMSALSDMGVNVVENEDVGEDGESEEDTPDEIDADGKDDEPAFEVAKKKETVDRTDDPVRMYLREMGAVELLSREGEIAIAKRIEAGRDTMILGLCESPTTFNAIIEWSTALNNGEMQLREILDLDAMPTRNVPPAISFWLSRHWRHGLAWMPPLMRQPLGSWSKTTRPPSWSSNGSGRLGTRRTNGSRR